jgi:hypothetical protein
MSLRVKKVSQLRQIPYVNRTFIFKFIDFGTQCLTSLTSPFLETHTDHGPPERQRREKGEEP